MNDIDKKAMERLMKARADVILSRTFYGVLVSQVEPVLSRQVPTMATDGKRHYVNPDFVNSLSPKHLLAVQLHESEHDARKHHSRRGGRDPKEWNIATDLAINVDLLDEGVELPDWVLVDVKYRGWSAEEIYRARELDRERQQQQQQQQQQPEQADQDEIDQGESQGQGGDDDSDGSKSEDNEKAPEEAAGETNGKGEEEGTAEGENEPTDTSNGSGGDEPSEPSTEVAGEPNGQGEGEAAGNSQSQPGASSGDPGGMGEVLDAADDPAELAESEQRWDMVLRQAASLARARGDCPGHVSRDIQRAGETKQDWREVLRSWIDQGSKRIETWNRPSRRHIGSGILLPGSQRDGLNKVVMAVDTSGSMDEVALKAINVEIQAAMDDGAIDEVVVVYGDTRVTRTDTYVEGDEVVFDPRGGGGTDLKPMFKWVEDNVDDPSLMIVFTDMEIGEPGPAPSCPALFAVTGYPDRVRRYLANLPWDAAGIDVGER